MILKFMTKRNTNGNRKYLTIDTDWKQYATSCRYMIPEADRHEVTANCIKALLAQCEALDYTREDYI